MKKLYWLFFILLSGCATQPPYAYKEQLDTWVGVPAQKLINSPWGIPSRTFTTPDGDKVYCYTQTSYYQTPVVFTPNFYGNFPPYSPGLGGQIINIFCKTCFFLNNHYSIESYTYRGNNCIANPAFRFHDFD